MSYTTHFKAFCCESASTESVAIPILIPPPTPLSHRHRHRHPHPPPSPATTTTKTPHQAATTWVYPSEQQYYNAIKRKGYKASATDMPSTLAIHNAVNEKGWEMIKDWERARAIAGGGNGGGDGGGGGSGGSGSGEVDIPPPKLLRFTGRPQDTSPKAWVKTNLLGYRPPFDR